MAELLQEHAPRDFSGFPLADPLVDDREVASGRDRDQHLVVAVVDAESVVGIDESPQVFRHVVGVVRDRLLDFGGDDGGVFCDAITGRRTQRPCGSRDGCQGREQDKQRTERGHGSFLRKMGGTESRDVVTVVRDSTTVKLP